MIRKLHVLGLGLLSILAAACGPKAPQAPTAPDGTYQVRGEIARLPAAGSREVGIRHEAIPDFRDEKGTTVGMDSMTMPFPAVAGVELGGLAVGDRGTFTFEVRWRGTPPLVLTRWEPLPAGTRLSFDPPDADAPDADQGGDPGAASVPK
jgi:hypothetical protein